MRVRIPSDIDAAIVKIEAKKKKSSSDMLANPAKQVLPRPDTAPVSQSPELLMRAVGLQFEPPEDKKICVEKVLKKHTRDRYLVQEHIDDIEMHLASARSTISLSKTSQDELKKECSQCRERIARAKEKLWRLPHSISRAKVEIERISTELSGQLSNTRREKLTNKLSGLEAQLTKNESELENTNEKLERLQVELADILAQIDDNAESQANVEAQIDEMERLLKKFNGHREILMRPHFYFWRNKKGDIVVTTANVEENTDVKSILRWSERLHRYLVEHNLSIEKNDFYEIVKFAANTESYGDYDRVMIVRNGDTDDFMEIIRAITDKTPQKK